MVHTFSDNKYTYSVDMMFAYIHFNRPNYVRLRVDDLLHNLEEDSWDDLSRDEIYSPLTVLQNPKQYKSEYERIEKADLSFPIIVNPKMDIIDGLHRLCKSYLQKNDSIKAYIFDNNLMTKFVIARADELDKVDNMQTYQFITKYVEMFR